MDEGPRGGGVAAKTLAMETVRLAEGEDGRADGGNARRYQNRAVGTGCHRTRAPEDDRGRDAHTHRALGEPMVGGKKGSAHAPKEKQRQQSIDNVEGEGAAPRK